MRYLLFTDNSAHTRDEIQALVDRFATAARQFSLQINIKKTKFLYKSLKFLNDVSLLITVSIKGESLKKCKTFKYLESTLVYNAKLDK